jgi:hypothetical protein
MQAYAAGANGVSKGTLTNQKKALGAGLTDKLGAKHKNVFPKTVTSSRSASSRAAISQHIPNRTCQIDRREWAMKRHRNPIAR